jgi:2,4-dienoyl-CoA reductase-like NADH-dependent reductase (Old Yellow Enzyme family)/thioredoxin reductase
MSALDYLFSPYKIGNCEIENRLVVAPMVANMNPDKGLASEQYIRYHEEKAKGGWGLIITEDYRVSEHAGGYPYIAGLYDEAQIESHQKLTRTIHQYKTKIFAQIYHAGRQATKGVNGGMQPVSCSPIPCPWNKEIPRELTIEEIRQIVKDFGTTARNVKAAGFDGVEIHAAHGYLIHQFLSPNSNKRIDEYGGSYENRARFLKEVMREVRDSVGSEFPMQVRLSSEEDVEGGRRMLDTVRIISDIESWGADSLHLTLSMYGARASRGSVGSFFQEHGYNSRNAAEAKKHIKIPVITVGRIQDPWMANEMIKTGVADFVAMGRMSLSDPHYPRKAKAGEYNEIRYCIGCLQGCTASTYQGVPLNCLANPELGHEFEFDYSPAAKPKKVSVVGGGPAGMEAARAAAIKGHQVNLYEAADTVGGQFISAAYPPYKGEFAQYPAWLLRQLKKLGVNIHLNTTYTAETAKKERPDKIIVATGALPIIPNMPGINGPNVVLAEDVLRGRSDTGMNVLVAGGGMVGTETAAYLSTQCKSKVGILEMRPLVGADMDTGIRDDMRALLIRNFVEIMENTSLKEITAEGALVECGGLTKLYKCDTVVLAIGTKSNNAIADDLRGICETVLVGDALKARTALEAVREGFTAGLKA